MENLNAGKTEYFAVKMTEAREDIIEFEGFIKTLDPTNVDGIHLINYKLSALYINCIKLDFCLNKPCNEVLSDYMECLKYFKEAGTTDSLYTIVDIVSLGVMLSENKADYYEMLKEAVANCEVSSDGMVVFMMNYLDNATEPVTKSRLNYFNSIMDDEDKTAALRKAQKSWYSKHRGAHWYDSHKSAHSVFYGYWSFDIAAMAKIYGISDDEFKGMAFYPVFN